MVVNKILREIKKKKKTRIPHIPSPSQMKSLTSSAQNRPPLISNLFFSLDNPNLPETVKPKLKIKKQKMNSTWEQKLKK